MAPHEAEQGRERRHEVVRSKDDLLAALHKAQRENERLLRENAQLRAANKALLEGVKEAAERATDLRARAATSIARTPK